jgi:tetratricopeptide (TPR) repeat protein
MKWWRPKRRRRKQQAQNRRKSRLNTATASKSGGGNLMATMPEHWEKLLKDARQARREGRHHDAKRDLIEAVDLCRKSGARSELARALADLGQIERDLHHADAALEHYEEAVAIYRSKGSTKGSTEGSAEGNDLRLAHTVRHVGDIHRSAGHAALAEPCYDEALNLYRANPQTTPLDLANTIRGLAILKCDTVDAPRAVSLWTEARSLYAKAGVNEGVAESDRRLARLTQREDV